MRPATGNKPATAPSRRGTAVSVERVGVPWLGPQDLYYYILIQPWSVFFLILIALYLAANCVFATLYFLQPGAVAEAASGSWGDHFFFSIETMATVGYGVMHPVTLYAHVLVVVEIIFGVLAVPVATGLTILKFARPSARVVFSRNAVVTPYDGVPTLIFRVANIRSNQILEARIKVTILRYETSTEGHRIRRLVDLPLMRDTSPMFSLSWSVMHRIDETSPLYGLRPVDWINEDLMILALMTGLDATASAMVHARYSYAAEDILVGRMFVDVVSVLPDRTARIDFRRFHDTEPTAELPPDEILTPVAVLDTAR
jgi:inward rectifier potassium channel